MKNNEKLVRILSWNVNGLRACDGKGFRRWLDRSGAELVGVQEVRARPEQLPKRLEQPRGWHTHFACATMAQLISSPFACAAGSESLVGGSRSPAPDGR